MNADQSDRTVPADLLAFVKAIAGETRVAILLLFMDGRSRTVNEIASGVGLSQPATSEQLSGMRRAGLLLSTRDGKEVYYRPNREAILKNLERLNLLLRECCER